MNPTPVLLFDLGGVLIENDMFGALKRLMGTDASESDLVERWLANPVARRFELGECDRVTFAHDIVAEFGLPLSTDQFLAQFATWPKGFAPETLTLLQDLASRYRIGCLSNSNEVHWNDALTAPFHFGYSSHLIGCIKPDEAAYQHVLTQEAVAPSRVIYFDDARSNVESARRCGIDAHRTVGAAALRSKLAELSLL